MKLKSLALVFALFTMVGCSSIDVTTYEGNTPTMTAETFYNGKLNAHGVFKDMSGEVIRYFNCTIDATWEGNVGVLDETFYWNDGEVQKRIWTITRNSDGSYSATAGDVVGEGVGGVAGNAMFLNYVLRVPLEDGDTIDLKVDDRMYLINENVLVNESIMSYFGIDVASALITIIKES